MNRAETLRAMRDRRAANRLCRDCAAGLQDADGLRCLECAELHRKSVRRYLRSKKGRMTQAAIQLRRYHADPESARTARREAYMAKKVAGECQWCRLPALDGSAFCAEDEERVRAQNRKYNRRKRTAAGKAEGAR